MDLVSIDESDSTFKKWFVYYHDKYHGPFSRLQIEDKIHRGIVSELTPIWSEALKDWTHIKNIDIFEIALLSVRFDPESEAESKTNVPLELLKLNQLNDLDSGMIESDNNVFHKNQVSNNNLNKFTKNTIEDNTGSLHFNNLPDFIPSLNDMIVLKFKSLAAFFLRRVIFFYYKNSSKIHYTVSIVFLISFVSFYFLSMEPSFENVSKEQLMELKSARLMSYKVYGPSVAIVSVNEDFKNPYFYISSNLPDDHILGLVIEALPESTLDMFYFKMEYNSKISNGYIKTPILKTKKGRPVPAGDYRINISCLTCDQLKENEKKSLLQKIIFLGGEKNHQYDENLRIYHSHLRRQAQAELIEIKQISETLDKQILDTATEYEKIMRLDEASHEKKAQLWAVFHVRWQMFQSQLDVLYNSWTEEILTENFYFGNFYGQIQKIAKKIRKIHNDQHFLISNKQSDDSLEYQIANDISLVQSEIQQLRVQAALTERLPPSSNGMPQKISTSTF